MSAELLAVLDPADADALRRIAELLGFDVDYDALPPAFVTLLETAAPLALAHGMPEETSFPERVRAACGALGLDARTVLRRHYRWQLAAQRQFVSGDRDAA